MIQKPSGLINYRHTAIIVGTAIAQKRVHTKGVFFQSLDGEWQFKFAADPPNIPEPFINPPVIIVITAQSRFPE